MDAALMNVWIGPCGAGYSGLFPAEVDSVWFMFKAVLTCFARGGANHPLSPWKRSRDGGRGEFDPRV